MNTICKKGGNFIIAEDMIGLIIISPSFPHLNFKIIERVVQKAFPEDKKSTLWIVKCFGDRKHYQIYEDEMFEKMW